SETFQSYYRFQIVIYPIPPIVGGPLHQGVFMRSLFVLAMACLLAACAQQPHVQLYSGSPLPESQVLTLVVPSELEIRSINGQPHSAANSMFGASDKRLHLQPGAYQVQAFYKNGFDINGGMSHELVRGRTAI